jgi:hypothetical protein
MSPKKIAALASMVLLIGSAGGVLAQARAVLPQPTGQAPVVMSPSRGGTGLSTPPQSGDILVGTGQGGYGLAKLQGGGTIGLTRTATALTLDTVQSLNSSATPTFRSVSLTALGEQSATTQPVGLDGNHQLVKISNPRQHVRVVDDPNGNLAPNADDQVIVLLSKPVTAQLPAADAMDGRILVFKSTKATTTVQATDLGKISLLPGQWVTVIASAALKQWLVIGRG